MNEKKSPNLAQYLTKVCNVKNPIDFAWPVKNPIITSQYGFREYPAREIHRGIDIVSSTDLNVYAAASGNVTDMKDTCNNKNCNSHQHGYGNFVEIYHGKNTEGESFKTFYAHLSKVYVKKGQQVKQGQCIGVMGETGIATGVHLHFEIQVNGNKCNPENFLPPIIK